MEKARDTNKKIRNRLTITILLILVALVALTAATAAWFTIADHARVQTMNLEIESGKELRIDLYKRRNFEDYVRTLSFRDIDGKIQGEKAFQWPQPLCARLQPPTQGHLHIKTAGQ